MAKDYETRTIVLKKKLTEDDARDIIAQKKTKVFQHLLRKPKRDEVHVHNLKLYYEPIMIISGKYTADFFRKATHTISVDNNVHEVILGDGFFPVKRKSGVMKKISKKGKNKVDLSLEEHVFIEEEDQMAFDHHGNEIKVSYKINSKTIENYPKKILKMNENNVKKSEITHDFAITKLSKKLKKPMDPDVRDLKDEIIIKDVAEIFVPIFEARLIGPKKKVGLLRIDAIRKKTL